MRPVVADDRQIVAALETERCQAAGQRAHALATSAQVQVCQMPRYFSRMAGALGGFCMIEQQPREGMQTIHRREIRLLQAFLSPLAALGVQRGLTFV
jgi:hypothetical protein